MHRLPARPRTQPGCTLPKLQGLKRLLPDVYRVSPALVLGARSTR
jgi:hypothetical protein